MSDKALTAGYPVEPTSSRKSLLSRWSCIFTELIFSHMTKHVFFRYVPKGEILASMIKHSQRGTQLCQRVQYNHWFQVEAAHVSSSFSDTWLKSYFEIIWQKENFWHRWYACSLKSLLRQLNIKFRALFRLFNFQTQISTSQPLPTGWNFDKRVLVGAENYCRGCEIGEGRTAEIFGIFQNFSMKYCLFVYFSWILFEFWIPQYWFSIVKFNYTVIQDGQKYLVANPTFYSQW